MRAGMIAQKGFLLRDTWQSLRSTLQKPQQMQRRCRMRCWCAWWWWRFLLQQAGGLHCPSTDTQLLTNAGIIAERGFNFEGHLAESHGDAAKASANAKALANALLVCLVVPWSLCIIAYTGKLPGSVVPCV